MLKCFNEESSFLDALLTHSFKNEIVTDRTQTTSSSSLYCAASYTAGVTAAILGTGNEFDLLAPTEETVEPFLYSNKPIPC